MNHPEGLLSAYLDGETTPAESRRLRSHMADCAYCRRQLYQINEMRAAVRSLPMLEMPAGLIPARVDEGHRSRRSLWLGAVAAVAAAVIAVATLVATPRPIAVSDISRQFGARASLDAGSASMKLVVPREVELP
ncbi:MAG: zf-HC2 domain-containing protein [Acidimicrobiia bacterium]